MYEERQVQRGQQRVHERVEVLGGDRRQMYEPHASIGTIVGRRDVRTAVDGHVVTAGRETRTDSLDGGLKPAVGGRHTAGTQQRELHRSPRSVAACS